MGVEWLVLFDIDGTLLHSGGCGRAATRLALQDVFGTTGQLDLSFESPNLHPGYRACKRAEGEFAYPFAEISPSGGL